MLRFWRKKIPKTVGEKLGGLTQNAAIPHMPKFPEKKFPLALVFRRECPGVTKKYDAGISEVFTATWIFKGPHSRPVQL
jgi:hypothetical protein